MVVQTQTLSLEEYIRLYEEEGAFEIIAGEWRKIMPPVMIHGWILRKIFLLIYQYCEKHNLGEVVTELPYVLTYDSNWVKGSRVPDLMFFARPRWEEYVKQDADWPAKPMLIVPDFVVEIVSQNDRYSEINEKVRVYEADKVRLIWIIDPHKKTVDVYENGQRQALSEKDSLKGGAVLPDLEIGLADLFALPKSAS
jgi:Uma2 family endonuclease